MQNLGVKKRVSFYGIDINILWKEEIKDQTKRILENSKSFPWSLPPASGTNGDTEIKYKELELSFNPQFIYEGFTSLD